MGLEGVKKQQRCLYTAMKSIINSSFHGLDDLSARCERDAQIDDHHPRNGDHVGF